ncbi:hypothetical protein LUV23_09975 [Streptomyces malaysiensis subsp. malaysiensis]|nr:hypothetical protein [Streptomyces sp. HNM0561]UHH23848.1 hypothetical protein LUV23_09975 [Streptomyces sp. HNM0561]
MVRFGLGAAELVGVEWSGGEGVDGDDGLAGGVGGQEADGAGVIGVELDSEVGGAGGVEGDAGPGEGQMWGAGVRGVEGGGV